jgi:cryptochrome
VTHLVFERDTDAYAKERDAAVTKAANEAGVKVVTRYGRTLWDSDEIVAKHDGKPTMSLNQLRAMGDKIGPIPRPIDAPKSLPDPGPMPVDFAKTEPKRKPDINEKHRKTSEKAYTDIAGPKGDFAVETLEELGFPAATTPHRGGETHALKALDKIIANVQYISTFRKPQTSPAQFEPQSTTLLSPHLHFGSLSVRLLYWRSQDTLTEYVRKGGKNASSPPESMTGQLLFRDMYFAAHAAIGSPFSQTLGNAHCRFIPWHLPTKVNPDDLISTGTYEVDNAKAEEWFQRWAHGMTGFPWIDALMRQLRQEGWIHHLGRHSVACFLTRGGAYISWERGADVFEELLIDHEVASNAGNWQWLSCTAFFAQFYRVYSPISFGQKWDKEGDFIRRYVPELAKLDKKYIYEPWKAPIADQKKAGVRVQGDGMDKFHEGDVDIDGDVEGLKTYPKPMFDFQERRRICLNSMKKAYDVGIYGDNPRVLDGTWKELFADGGKGTEIMGDLTSDDGGDEGHDGAEEPKHGEAHETGDATGLKKGGRRQAKRNTGQGSLEGFVKKRKK